MLLTEVRPQQCVHTFIDAMDLEVMLLLMTGRLVRCQHSEISSLSLLTFLSVMAAAPPH